MKKNKVLFLSRHGKGHKLSPSALPHKANIYALKKLGAGEFDRFYFEKDQKKNQKIADAFLKFFRNKK